MVSDGKRNFADTIKLGSQNDETILYYAAGSTAITRVFTREKLDAQHQW